MARVEGSPENDVAKWRSELADTAGIGKDKDAVEMFLCGEMIVADIRGVEASVDGIIRVVSFAGAKRVANGLWRG